MRYNHHCIYLPSIINVVIIGLILLGQSVYASDNTSLIQITPQKNIYYIGYNLTYLEDKESKWTIDDVSSTNLASRFQQSHHKYPNFGFTQSTYWFHFTIQFPKIVQDDWFLIYSYPPADQIDLYQPTETGERQILRMGDHLPFSQRPISHRKNIFKLSVMPGKKVNYYLRIQTSGAMNIPLRILNTKALVEITSYEETMIGFYYGSLLVMFIYNLLIFFSIRDKSYLYYAFFILNYVFMQMILDGIAFAYIWPNQVWWANNSMPFFITIAILSLIMFSRSFLRIQQYAPIFDVITQFLMIIAGFGTITALIFPYSFSIRLSIILSVITVSMIIISGILCLKNGFKPARYYLIAWFIFLIGSFIYCLKQIGWIPDSYLIDHIIHFGSIIGVIIFSQGLADRINSELSQKYSLQENALREKMAAKELRQEALNALEETAGTLEEKSEKMVTIAGQLEFHSEEMNLQTNNVAGASIQMTNTITSIASSVKKMSNNINNIYETTDQLSQNINSVASSIEEMSASIRQVGNNANLGHEITGEAMDMAIEAQNTMGTLGEAANEIGKVTDMIKRIADKTNLLALNAAIEAALAGEAGKGFAVVASAIQKFADQSNQAAEDIIHRLSSVQEKTNDAVRVISDVARIVREINQQSESIVAAMEEQNIASNEIVTHVVQASMRANDIAATMSEIAQVSEDISRNTEDVAKGFDDMTKSIQGVNNASSDSHTAVQQVNALAGELSTIAINLRGLVKNYGN